jgi:sugar phosphate permease
MAFVLGMFSFTKTCYWVLDLVRFGLGSLANGVPMQTLIQQQTPESMRGKVFGFQNNVVNIALSLPLAITGPLTDAAGKAVGSDVGGLRIVLLGTSFIVSLVGVWAWNNTRKDLRSVS